MFLTSEKSKLSRYFSALSTSRVHPTISTISSLVETYTCYLHVIQNPPPPPPSPPHPKPSQLSPQFHHNRFQARNQIVFLHFIYYILNYCILIGREECNAIKREEGPGNEIHNKIKNGGLFCSGTFSLFQRLVVHYQLKIPCNYFEVSPENSQNENIYCQVMK